MGYTENNVRISNGYVTVDNIGVVGLWWKYYDKKVTISYGFGESFIAQTEEDVKKGILDILNKSND